IPILGLCWDEYGGSGGLDGTSRDVGDSEELDETSGNIGDEGERTGAGNSSVSAMSIMFTRLSGVDSGVAAIFPGVGPA
ncbi:hypothetical protein M9458_055666, partial [Cirrhinus mrigala]